MYHIDEENMNENVRYWNTWYSSLTNAMLLQIRLFYEGKNVIYWFYNPQREVKRKSFDLINYAKQLNDLEVWKPLTCICCNTWHIISKSRARQNKNELSKVGEQNLSRRNKIYKQKRAYK